MSQNNVQLQNGNGPLAGLRNQLINGGMDVWQRGTQLSPLSGGDQTLGVEITSTQLYGCDRWESRSTTNSGGQCQQLRLNASFGKKLALETANTTSYQFIEQYIEVQNCISMSNQKCTFSWYSDQSTSRVRLSSYDASGTRVTEVDYTVTPTSLGNDRYSVTFDMGQINTSSGSENAKGVQIVLYPDGQNTFNGRCEFWNTQLELGPVATPFEHRPIGTELALCQRYYVTTNRINLYSVEGTDTNKSGEYNYPTTMRVAPTVTFTGTGITLSSGGTSASMIQLNSNSSGTITAGTITADAEL